jgi:hypothetical protein
MRKQFHWAASRGQRLVACLASAAAFSGNFSPADAQNDITRPPAFLRDTDDFTAHVAELYRRALPNATIKIVGPLSLTISGVSNPTQANLDSAYSFCLRNPRNCREALAKYVAKLVVAFGQPAQTVRRENLRAIVRPSAYIATAEKIFEGKGDPIAEPLVGDL